MNTEQIDTMYDALLDDYKAHIYPIIWNIPKHNFYYDYNSPITDPFQVVFLQMHKWDAIGARQTLRLCQQVKASQEIE